MENEHSMQRIEEMVDALRLRIRIVRAMTDRVLAELADEVSDRELGWRRAA
jgi:hypothetical protein